MKTNIRKIPSNLIKRNLQLEASFGIENISIYAYKDSDSSITILGQVFAGELIENSFCLIMTLYDRDGDIIESTESNSYGSGLVTSMIKPCSYFDGFPFKFYYRGNLKDISKISIVPASNY